jgi:hypothetical protein
MDNVGVLILLGRAFRSSRKEELYGTAIWLEYLRSAKE